MTDYKSFFEQAVRTLAAIDEALGIGGDGCGDPERTLFAIAELKANQTVGAGETAVTREMIGTALEPILKTARTPGDDNALPIAPAGGWAVRHAHALAALYGWPGRAMTPKMKRLVFPLRAPRTLSLVWTPCRVVAVAVDAYHQTFFAVLTPPGRGR